MNEHSSSLTEGVYQDSCINMDNIIYELHFPEHAIQNAKIGYLKPWTAPWILRQTANAEMETAKWQLKQYIKDDRANEVTEDLIYDLGCMTDSEAMWYIRELKEKPRHVVRTTGCNQMDIPCMIKTLDTVEVHDTKALLDSGCTTSCIDQNWAKEHGINLIPLPH